jgi:hypothetical protein
MGKSFIWNHAPGATLTYSIDWSDWLEPYDEIVSADWEVDTGITKSKAGVTGGVASVELSGGTEWNRYAARCSIVTASGFRDTRTIYLNVSAR